MSVTLDEIVELTRDLPDDVVSDLVDRIGMARHGLSGTGISPSWAAEIDQRVKEIEAGLVEGIPAADVFAKLQARKKQ